MNDFIVSSEIDRVIHSHLRNTGEYPERLAVNYKTYNRLIAENRQVMAHIDHPGAIYFAGVLIEPFVDIEQSIDLKIIAIGREL